MILIQQRSIYFIFFKKTAGGYRLLHLHDLSFRTDGDFGIGHDGTGLFDGFLDCSSDTATAWYAHANDSYAGDVIVFEDVAQFLDIGSGVVKFWAAN